MIKKRYARESPITQGEDESIAYFVDTTPWGGSPSSPTVVLKQDGVDVSTTHLTGSATIDVNKVIYPFLHSLVDGVKYRLELLYTYNNNEVEFVCEVWGEE